MATQPDKIPCPFADQGDYNAIPESGTLTAASWELGFPPLTAQPLDYGGEAPKREDINGVLKSLSDHIYYAQAGGVYPYSSDTNYDVPAIVYYPATGEMYLCVQANGPDTVVISPGEDTEEGYWKAMTGGEDGLPAGFGAVSAEASGLEPGDSPTASVITDGPDTAKTFHFKFGIPRGEKGEKGDPGDEGDPGLAAGFGEPTASAVSLDSGEEASASVVASGEDTAKVFSFQFGIPKGEKGDPGDPGVQGDPGEAAGFGTPTASATVLDEGAAATVTVTASGPNTAKVFTFAFGIPKGEKGDQGDVTKDMVMPLVTTITILDCLTSADWDAIEDVYDGGSVEDWAEATALCNGRNSFITKWYESWD